MPFSQSDTWTFCLPPLAAWTPIFHWIDRWEHTVYRVEKEIIRMWLPRQVGNGLLTIQPRCETELELTLVHEQHVTRKVVEQFLATWWDLDRNMQPFYDQFTDDSLLRSSITWNRGARIVGFPDLFEALVVGILGQQVNVKFAYTLKQRLTEAYGEALDWNGATWWRFPTYDAVLGADPDTLRQMQISKPKAEYILGAAEAMAEGRLLTQSLKGLPFPQQMDVLTSLRGIGNWTAQYVCMKCLHSIEAFPAGDAGLQNAAKSLLGMDRKPTVEELDELASAWKGWEAYATWFLWMS